MILSLSRMRFRASSSARSSRRLGSSSRRKRERFDLEMAGDFPFLARSLLRSDLLDGASSPGEEAAEDDAVMPSLGTGRTSSMTGLKPAPPFSWGGGAACSGFADGCAGGGIGGGSGSAAFEEFLVFLDLDFGAMVCKKIGNI